MAYTLGDKCAKNCCKRTIPVQLIVKNVVMFLRHSVVPTPSLHPQHENVNTCNCPHHITANTYLPFTHSYLKANEYTVIAVIILNYSTVYSVTELYLYTLYFYFPYLAYFSQKLLYL